MYPSKVWGFQVSLAIKRSGTTYTFQEPEMKDRFGQPVTKDMFGLPEPITMVQVPGIYHEDVRWTNSKVTSEEGSNMNQRLPESYILCEKKDTTNLKWGMTVVVANKTYRLVKSRDIEALDMFCDLVLEEVEPSGLSN